MKAVQAKEVALSPQKRTSDLQNMKFIHFFEVFSIFVGHLCPRGSGSRRLISMRIRILHTVVTWERGRGGGMSPSLSFSLAGLIVSQPQEESVTNHSTIRGVSNESFRDKRSL
jgi:hypothetical protein